MPIPVDPPETPAAADPLALVTELQAKLDELRAALEG